MATETTGKTALIVGASRGLGLAMAEAFLERGWRVIATVRGAGRTKLHDLAAKAGGALEILTLDVTSQDELAALAQKLVGRRLDLLFVNAGALDDPPKPIGEVSTDEFIRLMLTNALGPLRVVEALQSLVPRDGAIGVMSSGLGSVSRNVGGGYEAYRGTKAALNTMMRSFAARAGGERAILVMDPGWVRTDMGGANAELAVEESIPRLVDTIIANRATPGAKFLNYRGETVPW
ncbi:short-chain dehydrogenase/reductase SDR [Methylocella silvestris BL2]|uniref:Short-chain dehydrogenase/reductase SDR n=1 Tax=Methylocella silvestris (strain DSM 15510 / CIP 108128 / LMG 27833 / NCIMB 13906 / BL2) TaxID=395965 RepID=B8EQ74_METSB|nr:SDR family NAD(P)-dependent oxidoreductase [Methylocella silvestris]ACK51564.1 short-chain dehydrogenase/reductase SDR [Methylocella silvestris BL2]